MKPDNNEAIARLRTLKPGEKFVYFTGELSRAAEPSMFKSAERKAEALTVRELADAAYAQYKMGCVHLLQRRVGKNMFDYIAVAKK